MTAEHRLHPQIVALQKLLAVRNLATSPAVLEKSPQAVPPEKSHKAQQRRTAQLREAQDRRFVSQGKSSAQNGGETPPEPTTPTTDAVWISTVSALIEALYDTPVHTTEHKLRTPVFAAEHTPLLNNSLAYPIAQELVRALNAVDPLVCAAQVRVSSQEEDLFFDNPHNKSHWVVEVKVAGTKG